MINLKRVFLVFIALLCGVFAFLGSANADETKGLEIRNVSLSFNYPKVGTKFTKIDYEEDSYDQVPEIKVTSSNPNVETYAEIMDTNYNTFIGTVAAGKKYVFGIAIGAKDGYYLSQDKLNVTINGKKVSSFIYSDEEAVAFVLNYTYAKKANTMVVTSKNKKIKYKKLKKKKQVISAITVKKAQGKVTYKKVSGNKRIKVNPATGKITVKKKTKKGTYKIKVKVNAAGNSNYKSVSKTITLKIKIK